MQSRPKSKRDCRLGPAIDHLSQGLITCVKRAPAPDTGYLVLQQSPLIETASATACAAAVPRDATLPMLPMLWLQQRWLPRLLMLLLPLLPHLLLLRVLQLPSVSLPLLLLPLSLTPPNDAI